MHGRALSGHSNEQVRAQKENKRDIGIPVLNWGEVGHAIPIGVSYGAYGACSCWGVKLRSRRTGGTYLACYRASAHYPPTS